MWICAPTAPVLARSVSAAAPPVLARSASAAAPGTQLSIHQSKESFSGADSVPDELFPLQNGMMARKQSIRLVFSAFPTNEVVVAMKEVTVLA